MLMRTIIPLLFLKLLTIQSQSQYETIPLRFDLAINHIRQYQQISLDDNLETISLDALPTLLESFDKVDQCDRDFELLLDDAVNGKLWAIKVIDAWGKPLPSGVLKGNGYWTGNYDECVENYYQPQNKSFLQQPFNTQYCTLLPPASSSMATSKGGITLGICVPVSCNRSEVKLILHNLFKNSNITEDRLLCSNEPRSYSGGFIATCIILSFLGFLVLIGTIVDVVNNISSQSMDTSNRQINVYRQISEEPNAQRNSTTSFNESRYSSVISANVNRKPIFIVEFSAVRSLRRIFDISTRKNDDGVLPFLNGVRVLALFWVIIGHSIVFTLAFSINPLDVIAWTHNIGFQLIINAVFSVDTFFVLSGFLTTILFVRQVGKQGKMSFRFMVLYYLHRYLRLTPAFLIIVMISINLSPYFGHGPVFPRQQGFETPKCRNETWWTSILYISNLVHSDDMCLPITWYLHNDMQFHWVAPLALIPFVVRRKVIAFVVATLMVLLGIISTLTIILYYPNLSLNAVEAFVPQVGPTFFKYIYIKPWCRISAYAIGVLVGFLVINAGRTYRMKSYLKYLGTLIAITLGLLCIFGTYPDYVQMPGLSRTTLTAFQTLSRPSWALAIGWLIFLCSTNQGGLVNKILSWSFWTPLARLNYSAYLIHTIVIDIGVLNQTMPTYYQATVVLNTFISHIFFSYVAAIVVYIFIETPFFLFEKKLFTRA